MANTDISICSNALLRLGDAPISSFNESNDRSRLARNTYLSMRDAVLARHPWNCATRRVVLSPDATAPAFDWEARFLLPADCLRILSVGERGEGDDYEVEDGYILMDGDTCRLRYVYRAPEAKWDPLLVESMTEAMRRVFAYPLTGGQNMEATIFQIADEIVRAARAVDGQENPPEMLGNEGMFSAGF